MAADKTAKFSVNLEGNIGEKSDADAKSLAQLNDAIKGSQDKIKGYGAALRNLRGDSDDVKAAKDRLRAAIGFEKDALSTAQIAALKFNGAQKEATEGSSLFGKAVGMVKGPLLGLTQVALGLTATMVGLAAGFAGWLIKSADAQRNLALTREAFAGSAENGARLGTQVDALAAKIPIAKDKLNEMAVQLMRTRLSGQAIVDTFNVIGTASAAMGDDVGKALGDIITRGQMWNRFRLNPLELQGTGVMYKDVAAQLAKNLNIGIRDAQKALFEGRVKLEDGAKALRQTVEKRFGEVNAKKMLSLGVQFEKFKENLAGLTKDVDLTPILQGVQKIGDLFSMATVPGQALHDVFTKIGQVMGVDVKGGIGLVQTGIELLILGGVNLAIAFVKTRNALKEAFAPDGAAGRWIDGFMTLIHGVEAGIKGIASAAEKVSTTFAKLTGGGSIGGQLREALTGGRDVEDLAKGARAAGVGGAAVHSVGGGVNQLAGFADGGEVPRPKSPDSVFVAARPGERIVPPSAGRSAYGGDQSGGMITVAPEVHFHFGGGASAEDLAKQISAPSFLAQLTKAVEDAAKTIGAPNQTAPQV